MSTPSESLSLLARAAELRAAGSPWEAAATTLAVSHGELRRLVAGDARGYERLARRAREEFRREAAGAALATLRDLLTAPEQGVRLVAATSIVRYHVALLRHDQRDASDRLRRTAHRLEGHAGLANRTLEGPRADPAPHTSELPEVAGPDGVSDTEKTAQAATSAATPTTAPAVAKPAGKTATLLSGKHHLRLDALARRARGKPEPGGVAPPPTLEVEGLLRRWLPE